MRYDLWTARKYTSKRNRNTRGFTLIELIITIAIMAILVAVAFPNFQRIVANGNLKTAARDLVADFNSLKESAIAENREYILTFPGGNAYEYTAPAAGGNPAVDVIKRPSDISRDITGLAPSAGLVAVNFRTRGTIDPPGNIVLTNRLGSTATITFNISGRTNVQFNMQ
jgi:prepilin-type N-terminal cleavage/methylation domain-containing protein